MANSVFDGEDTLAGIVWVISGLGALTWGTIEFFGFNLVTEVAAATSPEVETAAYALIGLSGAITLADNLGLYDVTEVVEDAKGVMD